MKYKKALSFLLSASLALSPAAPVYAYDVDSGGNTEISADTLEKTQEKTEELTSDTCEVPGTNAYSGTCGENLTWTLDSAGTLTISGTGAMTDYSSDDAPWYRYSSNIKSLIISDGVTSIGAYAFLDCYNLTSVTIGDGVTSIGEGAFECCESLTSVTIGDSVTSIGGYAFHYCPTLTEIVIPNSVVSIGECAFGECYGLASVTIGDGVTSIGVYAFFYCSSLTSVTIGDSVTDIGDWAFDCCDALSDVYYCGSEEEWNNITIGQDNDPLLNAKKHFDYHLHSYGEWITDTAAGCETDGEKHKVCSECGNIITEAIPATGHSYGEWITDTAAGCETDGEKHKVCSECGNIITEAIPATGHSYGEWITDTAAGCETDGEKHKVCSECGNIITEAIPATGHSYGEWIKSNAGGYERICSLCEGKETAQIITIDSSTCGANLTWALDSAGTLTISGTGAMTNYSYSNVPWYSYRSNINSLIISDGVTSIGGWAFQYCSNLTSVTIGDSVTSIGGYAFYGCSSLTSVTIPDSVTSIGGYAFYGCSSLTSVTIPDSVTSIGGYAFSDCSSLTSITIPDSVISIGDYAFRGCSSLAKVYITDIAKWCEIDFVGYDSNPLYYGANLYVKGELLTDLVIPDGVTNIDDRFRGCSSLVSVTIPDSVTSIGGHAFYNCSSLTSVTIGDSVTSIGGHAFYNCSSLTSITIPDSVTSIGGWAFYDCSSLESVTIGDSVTSIGERTFYYCSSLTSVTIGDSVTSIGSSAFDYCSNLESVYITSIESWCNISFYNSYSNPFYYAEKLYLNGELVTELVLPADITSVNRYVFYDIECIKSLVIPDGVVSISSSAFYGCSGIETVTLPKSLVKINEDAFSGCSSIKKVYYAGSESEWNEIVITSGNDYLTNAKIVYGVITDGGNSGGNEDNSHGSCIASGTLGTGEWVLFEDGTVIINGTGALKFTDIPFYKYRDTITSVKISDGITSIPEDTFYKCDKIKTVIIPQSLTSIGDSAFWRCTSIEEVYYKGTEAEWESITISEYNDYLTNAVITYNYSEKTEVGIKFLARPQKTVYTYGESLSLDGAVVVKTYSDGSFTEIEDYEVSGYDSNKFGTQFVVITHGDHSFEYKVTVEPKKAQTVTAPVEAGTTVEEFSSPYAAIYEVFVFDAERKTILDKDDIVKTGCVVQFIRNGEVVDSIAIVVGGDITGDGIINAKDLLRLKKQLSEGSMVARGEYADINRDGVVTEADVDALMQMM